MLKKNNKCGRQTLKTISVIVFILASVLLFGCVQPPGGVQPTEKPLSEIIKEDIPTPTTKAVTITPIATATPTPTATKTSDAPASPTPTYAPTATPEMPAATSTPTVVPPPYGGYSASTPTKTSPTQSLQASTTTVPIEQVQRFSVELDDSGWYPNAITMQRGVAAELTMTLRTTNVYFGGADIKSPTFNELGLKAGESRTVRFTPQNSFTASNYWPSTGIQKGTLSINVE